MEKPNEALKIAHLKLNPVTCQQSTSKNGERMKRQLHTLMEIRPLMHSQAMITRQVSVEQIIRIMRSMAGISYFSPVFIEGGRHVSGGGYSYSPTPKSDDVRIKRTISCSQDPVWYRQWNEKKRRYSWYTHEPIWQLEVHYNSDNRYFQEASSAEDIDESMFGDPEYISSDIKTPLDAWHQDSEVTVYVRSSEGRIKFEKDIESMIHKFYSMRHEIRALDCWSDKGLEIFIKCQCGHSSKKSISELSGQQKQNSSIFEIEPMLRCSVCNKKGRSTLIPLYRFRDGFLSPSQCGYYSKKLGKPDRPDQEGASLSELYDALGGDGVQDVYVSDDVYLSPSDGLDEDKDG